MSIKKVLDNTRGGKQLRMDTDKVVQDLNRRFAAPLPEFYKRRIIFWYDEDKEFEDKLDEVVLENAKVIALTINNFVFREKTAFGR